MRENLMSPWKVAIPLKIFQDTAGLAMMKTGRHETINRKEQKRKGGSSRKPILTIVKFSPQTAATTKAKKI